MKPFMLLLALGCCFMGSSQTTEPSLLTTPSPWAKEIIPFPIAWAPKLQVEGFEELRFAPKWRDPQSADFWTYVMAWELKAPEAPNAATIEGYLEAYYEGLMTPNHWATTFPGPTVLLEATETGTTPTHYRGKIKVFDGFHTGKMMTLHLRAEVQYCSAYQKSVLLFRLSTQPPSSPMWETLERIALLPGSCE